MFYRTFSDEEFPDSDDLFDTTNFKELKIQIPSDSNFIHFIFIII